MKPKVSITLTQNHHLKYDSSKPVGDQNPEYIYQVLKVVNTLDVAIHQRLEPKDVARLIQKGYNVTIQGDK